MRILHLISYSLFSGPLPGALALAQAQARRGHRVYWAYDAIRGDFDGFEEAADAAVAQSGLAPPPGASLAISTKASWRRHLADWAALRRLCICGRIDVIHTHLSHDLVLVRLALLGLTKRCRGRVRHVHTVHTALAERRVGRAMLLRGVDHLIVRCTAHQKQLLNFGATLIPGSIDALAWDTVHAVPNASSPSPTSASPLSPASVPPSPSASPPSLPAPASGRVAAASANDRTSRRQSMRTALKIADDAPVVGLVALMDGRGQEELLAASAILAASPPGKHRPLHVLLVGSGRRAQALRELAARQAFAESIHFTGYLPQPRLRDAYAAMDAALVMQPGKDPAARPVLEAMASGLPVFAPITSSVLADAIDTDCGYPLPDRTPKSLAMALLTWLNDVQAGRRRGLVAAERIAASRHIDREVEATLAVYVRPRPAP